MIWYSHVYQQWLYVRYVLWPSYSPECCVVLSVQWILHMEHHNSFPPWIRIVWMRGCTKCPQHYAGLNEYHCPVVFICRIALNFRGSLISWIFNCLHNYFNEIFWHLNCSFHVQKRQWTTSRGYAAKSARDTLKKDTFEVGIALLTAASPSADNSVTVYVR